MTYRPKMFYNQYRNLCLLNWNLPNPIEVDLIPLNDFNKWKSYDTDRFYFFNKYGRTISPLKGIMATEIITTQSPYSLSKSKNGGQGIFTIRDNIIPDRYLCTHIFFPDKVQRYYRLTKGNPDVILRVKIDSVGIKEESVRWILHGFHRDDYSVIVVGKDAPLLGYHRPYHGNCWIYPIRTFLTKDDLPDTRDAAAAWLREEGRMEELVPEYIVRIIMKHNILGRPYPDNEEAFEEYKREIHDAYICLLLDNKFGFKETTQEEL